MMSLSTVEPNSLLIVGASARAAAWSAIRAGLRPFAVDCFADCDLKDRAWAQRITDYPGGILAASRQLRPMPWIFTGGLENDPQLVDELAAEKSLLGNSGDVLRKVRDPEVLAEAWNKMDLLVPAISRSPPNAEAMSDDRWLVKRRRSAGGLGVHWFRPPNTPPHDEVFYQRYVPGSSWSSLYVGNGHDAVLLGISRQWVGARQLGGWGFLYCGSFTARRWPVNREVLLRLGRELAAMFSLVGLFGVDWICHQGEIWPLEVNPRYTASCEVFEMQHDWPLMEWHVDACRRGALPQVKFPSRQTQVCGKAILYARSGTVVTDGFQSLVRELNNKQGWPQVADVPATGSRIEGRHPVVTLFAQGSTFAETKARLLGLAVRIRRELAC